MLKKVFGIFAVLVLVGACSTASDSAGDASSDGSSGSGVVGAKPGTQEDLVVSVGDRVYFAFDKYSLTQQSRKILEGQAAWLKKYGNLTITVEGHCDERGTREYNLGLGERRANAVKDYLTALGVAPSRIKTLSYGEERPVALGSTETAWGLNRRAVTAITGGAGS